MLLQSSGTTGGPKIVRRAGVALDAVASNVMQATQLTCVDRVLAMVPMCHSYGVENVLLAPVLAGAEIVAVEGIERPSVSGVLESAQITVFPGFPFVFQMLLEEVQGQFGHVLRLAYSAGSVLPEEFIEALAQRAGIQVGQLYGTTEIGSVTFNDPADGCSADHGVGLPMPGVDIRILDVEQPSVEAPLQQGQEGHVAVRAPSMLECYVDSDVQALDKGFFLTGDLGRMDPLGNLFVTGRLKLQIDVGGAKVNPLEVEAVLRQADGVHDCVVVSMPVNATLNRLRALVELDAASARPTPAMLRSHVRSRLAAYKVPRIIEFCDHLPRSPMGKILRQEIQEQPA
jgi:long-chain acyl-CoA synthetase